MSSTVERQHQSPARLAHEQRLKELLDRSWRMLIGGELVGAQGGVTYETASPADGRKLADVPLAQVSDVEAAVGKAKDAFPQWARTPLVERVARVRELVGLLRAHAKDLGILDAIDSGNPVGAMVGDVGLACSWLEYQAGVALEVKGQNLPSAPDIFLFTRREPYGVVGRIIPFNHPILFAAAKIGPPVLMGNTLVLKVGEQTPLSALAMGELIKEVFPPGVVNIVTGDAGAGQALVRHPAVKRIALTGSVETGQRVQAAAAEVGVKHVSLELGGKNPMIVFADADLDAAAGGVVFGMNCHWCQGQSCGSTTRLFVHESVHDELLARIVARLGRIRIGHPLDPETEMGSLVSKAQYEKVVRYVELGKQQGALLACGGGKPAGPEFEKGFFFEPTVFDRVTMQMQIAQDEIFGPVLSVLSWSDREKVMDEANATRYGLTAAVWTRDARTALDFANRLDVGYVWINGSGRHFLGAPFTGHKNSGVDSEEGLEELYSFTQLKTVSLPLND